MPHDPFHRTGRTFRLALRYLLWMSEYPGEWRTVQDHHGTRAADDYLYDQMLHILAASNIPFEANRVKRRIRIMVSGCKG